MTTATNGTAPHLSRGFAQATGVVLICILAAGSCLAHSTGEAVANDLPAGALSSGPTAVPQSQVARTLSASYYSVENGTTATVMINNKSNRQIQVTPTLHALAGTAYVCQSVSVAPSSFQVIDIQPWVTAAGTSFVSGSIDLAFVGQHLEIGAQVRLVSSAATISFDEQMVEPAVMFASSVLAAAWWVPTTTSTVSVALSNTSAVSRTVTVVTSRTAGAVVTTSWVLAPHQTRVLSLKDDLLAAGSLTLGGAVVVSHTGSPGDVLARGYAMRPAVGFSVSLEFQDPGKHASSSFHGAGARFADVGGEALTSYLVVHNRGAVQSTVSTTVHYSTQSGSQGQVSLANVSLNPGEVIVIAQANQIAPSVLSNIASAGVVLTHTGSPGSLIASALAVSSSLNHVFRVPLTDPSAVPSSTGGYPWLITATAKPMIYVKNTSPSPQDINLEIDHNGGGGAYSYGLKTLAANETFAVDIRAIRDQQVPDEDGHLIPIDATNGQVYWTIAELDVPVIIGRIEHIDATNGSASTYACANICPNSFVSGIVEPPTAQIEIDTAVSFRAREFKENSFFLLFTESKRVANSRVTWTAVDPGTSTTSTKATVDSNGIVTAISTGAVEIRATWEVHEYLGNTCGEPNPNPGRLPCCVHLTELFTATANLLILPKLILSFGHTDLYPTNSGKAGAVTSTIITVDTDPPTPNTAITLRLSQGINSFQHLHHSGVRPLGWFNSLGMNAEITGATDQTGRLQATYTASEFAGEVNVHATLSSGFSRVYTKSILVSVPGLVEIQDSNTVYRQYGQGEYEHSKRHSGKVEFVNKIFVIAAAYSANFYPEGGMPLTERLYINDLSLPLGGKFEAFKDQANWCTSCSHMYHRLGRNADVSKSNMTGRMQAFQDYCNANGVFPYDEDPYHFHLRLASSEVE